MSKTIPLLLIAGLLPACGMNTETVDSTQIALESATRVPQKGGGCRSDFARGVAASFKNAPGFAGVFLGFDGNEVSLFHTERAHVEGLLEAARHVLADQHQAVYDKEGNTTVRRLSEAKIVPVLVNYSLEELIEVEESLCEQLTRTEAEAEVRIDYPLNRIIVAGAVEVPERFQPLTERRPYRPAEAMSNIRDFRRPVVAGAQSLYAAMNQSTETCTIGFVARFGSLNRYITASHCSPQLFSVPGIFPPEFRQNGWTAFDGVGTEVMDPAPNCGTACRNTDATVSSVVGSVTFGVVAVPTQLEGLANPACSNNGSCTQTTVGNPGVALVPGPGLLPGANIERIGRTSGRVFGQFTGVSVSPITIGSARHGNYRVGRHGRVVVAPGVTWVTGSRLAASGDSGGPVLRRSASFNFIPDGIVFASRSGIAPIEPPDYQFSTLSDLAGDLGGFVVF